jgi:hypothetical protein
MNRRELLTTGVVSTLAAATTAIDRGSEVIDQNREAINERFKSLEARFDKLEHHHKNLIRVGGIAFALSTGIDVVTFL